MKKVIVLAVAMFFMLAITACDKDECSVCHECECVCIK